MTLTNPKIIFENGKSFVIDAPDDSMLDYDKIEYDLTYYEALFKAPRWEIKNKEEAINAVRLDMRDKTNLNKYLFDDWLEKEENGKLYDLPKGYRIELKELRGHEVEKALAGQYGRLKYWCDECCNGDRCDDPTHLDRRNCPYCNGKGTRDFNQIVILIPEEEVKEIKETPYQVYKVIEGDEVNSILSAALRTLSKDKLISLRDALIERTPVP